MRTFPSAKTCRALTLLEVLLLVVFLGVVALLAWPAMQPHRCTAQKIACSNNLKQDVLSFRLFAGDNEDHFPMEFSTNLGGSLEFVGRPDVFPHFLVMSNELNTPKILFCPEDKDPRRRRATTFGDPARESDVKFQSNTNLSYFLGVDAREIEPRMFIVGDDHFAIKGVPVGSGLLCLWTNSPVDWRQGRHIFGGNIGLVDGSVQQTDAAGLQLFLQQTGFAANRLAMP
jgi:hypothetical protein